MNHLEFCNEKTYNLVADNSKKAMLKHEVYKALEDLICRRHSSISVDFTKNGFERTLKINSSGNAFLITGFDSSKNKIYGIRESLSLLDGEYLIDGNVWSGVFLTRDLAHVRNAFSAFIEKEVFDELILVPEE